MTASKIPSILFGSPYLNPRPIAIDDRPRLHKRDCYILDILPVTIYVASEKSVSTLTTPSDLKLILLLPSDDPNFPHAINKYDPYCGRVKIGYCYRKHDEKDATKRQGSIAPRDLIKTGKFITVMVFQY